MSARCTIRSVGRVEDVIRHIANVDAHRRSTFVGYDNGQSRRCFHETLSPVVGKVPAAGVRQAQRAASVAVRRRGLRGNDGSSQVDVCNEMTGRRCSGWRRRRSWRRRRQRRSWWWRSWWCRCRLLCVGVAPKVAVALSIASSCGNRSLVEFTTIAWVHLDGDTGSAGRAKHLTCDRVDDIEMPDDVSRSSVGCTTTLGSEEHIYILCLDSSNRHCREKSSFEDGGCPHGTALNHSTFGSQSHLLRDRTGVSECPVSETHVRQIKASRCGQIRSRCCAAIRRGENWYIGARGIFVSDIRA